MQVEVVEERLGWRCFRISDSMVLGDHEPSIQVRADTVLPESPKPVDDPLSNLDSNSYKWIRYISKNACHYKTNSSDG